MTTPRPTQLSWQTGELVFRNQSLAQVRRHLEACYGTPIPLYVRSQNNWIDDRHEESLRHKQIRDEIRLILFVYYNGEDDELLVRGVEES
ncbi:MAG: hypothetical protein OHK0039_01510 [Bacteroidia bacterium]